MPRGRPSRAATASSIRLAHESCVPKGRYVGQTAEVRRFSSAKSRSRSCASLDRGAGLLAGSGLAGVGTGTSSGFGALPSGRVASSARHWAREETAQFRTARVQSKTGRPAVELVTLARGEIPRARTGYWSWPCSTLRDLTLAGRNHSQGWALKRSGWYSERAGLRSRSRKSNASECWFVPSAVPDGVLADSCCRD
jgi:hypothetical protein